MKKIGFLIAPDENWLGGVNYYKNLFWALCDYASNEWEVVVFVPKTYDLDIIKDYPPAIKIVRLSVLSPWSCVGIIRRIIRKLFKNDYMLKRSLDRHGISVVSHISGEFRCRGIKKIAWIPDFQHKYLPNFFSKDELKARDRAFLHLAKAADIVVLSSNVAKADFIRFFPVYKEKAQVLQFVPRLEYESVPNLRTLCSNYSIPKKFFYLPNQYWIHKNHKIVLRALKLLQDEGREVVVISTGKASDYRAPRLMDEIELYIRENRLQHVYRILGTIPYVDTRGLSMYCHAFINPSLFEGWSTTVEEAKCYGKPILLSDLSVHREQKPANGIFFDPKNAQELADKMWEVWNISNEQCDVDALLEINHNNQKAFAERYWQILGMVGKDD